MGSYHTMELIETFINYQESIKKCICIIYDPQRTKTGGLKVTPKPPYLPYSNSIFELSTLLPILRRMEGRKGSHLRSQSG